MVHDTMLAIIEEADEIIVMTLNLSAYDTLPDRSSPYIFMSSVLKKL